MPFPYTLRRLVNALVVVPLLLSATRYLPAETIENLVSLHRNELRAYNVSDAAALNKRFRNALGIYMSERTPTDASQRDMFLKNLAHLIEASSKTDLQNVDKMITSGARPGKNSGAFNDHLDAVAFFTAYQNDRAGKWSRRPGGELQEADALTDWAANKAAYQNFKLEKERAWGDKRPGELSSSEPADVWIGNLAAQLNRLYNDPRLEFGRDPGLIADLARAQYLMIGEVQNAQGNDELYGLRSLDPLAETLQNSAAPSDAADAERQLDRLLTTHEQLFGFRPGDVMPTGILTENDFFEIISSGYLPNDIGAGVTHGSLTHRLQWNIIMTDFDTDGAGKWHNPPLALVTGIGAFDKNRAELNAKSRFEFERTNSLWARLFDLPGNPNPNPDLSHPDSVEGLLKERSELGPIQTRINLITTERRNTGLDLLKAVMDRKTNWKQRDWKPKDLSAVRARAATSFPGIVAERLYDQRYFDKAKAGGAYQEVKDEKGKPRNLLIRTGLEFVPEPDKKEIANQRQTNANHLAPPVLSERPASTRREPARLRSSDAIATSSATDRRRREPLFRSQDSAASERTAGRNASQENDDPDRDFIPSSDDDPSRSFMKRENEPAYKTTERPDSVAAMVSVPAAEASTSRKQQRRAAVDSASDTRRSESTAENAGIMRSAQNTPRLERRAESTAATQAGNVTTDAFRRTSRDTDTRESGPSRTRSAESPRREGRRMELAR